MVCARKLLANLGLIKQFAKTLMPNKDSDKRLFGRCVVMEKLVSK